MASSIISAVQQRLEDPTIPWQKVVLLTGLGVSAFEGWIGSRQKPYFSAILHPHIPASLQPYLPASQSHQTYLKSQSYALAKLNLGSVLSLVDTLESYLLFSGALGLVWEALGLGSAATKSSKGFPWLDGTQGWTLLAGVWNLAGTTLAQLGRQGEIQQSLVFVAILTLAGTVLGLPKSWYKNFVLEETYGFNKTTKKTWVADQVKGLFLSLALELPVLAGILRIIQAVGKDGVLNITKWLMVFILTFQLIMIPLYPYIIAPLFNTFTPLPTDSPVYPLVKDLADRLNFPLGRVWVMDGSKRSAHSNAFFFGLPGLTKHIVIYDTLIEKSEPEEIQAILAHELGHWSMNHVPILLLTSLVQTFFTLLCFTLFLSHPHLVPAFGLPTPTESQPLTIVSLLLGASLFTPLSAVLHFFTNGVTRLLEYQADAFAVNMGRDVAIRLKSALVKIHEQNLAIYGVDPVYSAYNNNHPTLVERLEALDQKLDNDEKKAK